jgi:hypothetical protein
LQQFMTQAILKADAEGISSPLSDNWTKLQTIGNSS